MKMLRKLACLAVLTAVCSPLWGETISQDQNISVLTDRNIDLTGSAQLHLTSKKPMENSTVNIIGENAWLYFDAVKPTNVVSTYLPSVKIDGTPADITTNVRIAEYGAGTVLIPHGIEACEKALTIYSGANFTGDSQTVAIENFNTDLGKFDNNIRSIKLRKGFMAVLANNPDGTGYSRCYIASDGDLEIPELQEGFTTKDGSDRSFVSYIRVTKWQWVTKKGWCGWNQDILDLVNCTHSYGWSAGGPTDKIDREYVPQRHHIGWPSFDEVKRLDNVSHLLGHNEPDNTGDPKEKPSSPEEIISEWPEFFKTGLRIGSPAPTGIWGNWLTRFFNLADSLNYRVDFVVYHQYEHTADFASRVNKAVEVSHGRPVWITEWNNGANWTTNNENDWPNKTGIQCDADGNPLENGGTVTLPATKANQEKQLEYMKKALANIDACDKLERTHFYNAVQDARAVELSGKLTLSGKYFADYASKIAFNRDAEYVHNWKIAPPFVKLGYSDDYKNTRLTWYDHNGETGKSYTVYRRDDSNKTYNPIKVLELGKDYQAGQTVVFEDPIKCSERYRYYVKATAYDGKESIESRKMAVWRDNEVEAVELKCSSVEPTTVRAEWTETEGARGYRLERRLVSSPEKPEGETDFTVVLANTSDKSYNDTHVTENSVYAYRVAVLSNADGTPYSDEVRVTTPSISTPPEGVLNAFAGSGDAKVSLAWDKTYRTTWTIERADSENGPWSTIKENISQILYDDTEVQNGMTYYYRILPTRLGMKGDYSEILTASPKEGNFMYIPFCEGGFFSARDYFNGKKSTLSAGSAWVEDRNGNAKSAVYLKPGKEAYIQLPNSIMSTISDFTIAVWIKPGTTGGRIFDFGTSTSKFMVLNYSGGQFRYKLTDGTSTVDKNNIAKSMPEGEWSHVVLTQSGNIAKLYVNGEEVTTITDALAPSIMGKTTANYLGKSQWSSDPHPDFTFDDLYIFNRGMDASEVKTLMQTPGISEVDEIMDDNLFDIHVENGDLVIVTSETTDLPIYSVDGRIIKTVYLSAGENRISGLDKGIYIAKGKKVFIR